MLIFRVYKSKNLFGGDVLCYCQLSSESHTTSASIPLDHAREAYLVYGWLWPPSRFPTAVAMAALHHLSPSHRFHSNSSLHNCRTSVL